MSRIRAKALSHKRAPKQNADIEKCLVSDI